MGELSRHLDHIDLAVADQAQVFDQPLGIDHLSAANHLGQVGVEAHRRAAAWSSRPAG